MTLKEKFKNILIDWIDEYYNREHVAEIIEIDADNYAIEFAEWLMDGHVSKLTLNEFKKEKGL